MRVCVSVCTTTLPTALQPALPCHRPGSVSCSAAVTSGLPWEPGGQALGFESACACTGSIRILS